MTVLGTRPEIIRLSVLIGKLDKLCFHILVHTGQNYDDSLSYIFFQQLDVRSPNYFLGTRGTFGEQLGTIMPDIEGILLAEKPDRFLVLGDTNSGLTAIMAKRSGIPVYHMEAGNRCYDDSVPEEVNRRIIDHCSDVLMPYTHRSKENLLQEGIERRRIHIIGNPIREVLDIYSMQISNSNVLAQLDLLPQQYFLVTAHRAETIDVKERLLSLLTSLDILQRTYDIPVIVSTHPHTRQRMNSLAIRGANPGLRFLEPLGFFDFIKLEQNAYCVLSDSGTVQEECAIFGIPNVTIRDVTERPEIIECGSGILSGIEPGNIMRTVGIALGTARSWTPPAEYMANNVSSTVAKIVLGQ